MSNVTVTSSLSTLSGEVILPASKSISNRVLIINALAGASSPINNLAKCDDTDTMVEALNTSNSDFNVGHAGTAMRFLTAYLAQKEGIWTITGSERMKQRPIGVLVDALRTLGAKIEYLENNGFPPLSICGRTLDGGELHVSASISSQYISALMMIAPYMKQGLTLCLEGHIASRSYIEMTASIMKTFGAEVEFREPNIVHISNKPYATIPYTVESDWSAASYMFELLALSKAGSIELPALYEKSLQGDSLQVGIWRKLGVECKFSKKGAILTKSITNEEFLNEDFTLIPDIAQTFAVACCMKGVHFRFTGVETLRIKETDRIAALQAELFKLGFIIKNDGDSTIFWDGERVEFETPITIATYNDHRMAMAFAPSSIIGNSVTIQNSEVVSKSFPDYWTCLSELGIKLSFG